MPQRDYSRQNNIENVLQSLLQAGGFSSAVVASNEGLPLATAGNTNTTLIAAVAASIKNLAERAQQSLIEITSRSSHGECIIIRYFSVEQELLLLSLHIPAGQHPYRRLTNRAISRHPTNFSQKARSAINYLAETPTTMSSIVTNQGVVHYEVSGHGRPIILLHGWLGSWEYWAETMAQLQSSYRAYALDFWGFGDSGKRHDTFLVPDFVALVDEFMERLGIEAAPVIGHSMGGTVALSLALAQPHRVQQIAVIGSPINGASLSFWLKLAGEPWAARMLWQYPFTLNAFLKLFSLRAVKESQRWYQMVTKDVSDTTLDSFFSSIRSLRRTDLTHRLDKIAVPIMGMYGAKDIIVNPHQAAVLETNAARPHIVRLPGSGHFPMLDEPETFHRHLSDFIYHEL